MKVYIVTYRYMADRERGVWTNERILQKAYTSLEVAQRYIRKQPGNPIRVNDWYYKTDNYEEYYIREVLVSHTEKKRKFWGVSQKYFDSGAVKVRVFPVEAEEKPESVKTENKMCDEYIDYFDTREEADEWAEQARNA